jgi:hypothetical protein
MVVRRSKDRIRERRACTSSAEVMRGMRVGMSLSGGRLAVVRENSVPWVGRARDVRRVRVRVDAAASEEKLRKEEREEAEDEGRTMETEDSSGDVRAESSADGVVGGVREVVA